MSRPSILITGGLGYIGSHAAVYLSQIGYEPIIIDNCINSSKTQRNTLSLLLGYTPKCYFGNIGDIGFLRSILQKHPIQGVWHFASLKSPSESLKNTVQYYDNNVSQLQSALSVFLEFGVKDILFSSSASVYAQDDSTFFRSELSPVGPIHPYGQTKLIGEQILHSYAQFEGFRIGVLRYFNPIGCHDSGLIGEKSSSVTPNIFPLLLDVIQGKRQSFKIFGGNYQTPDGTGIRDYIHVQDLVLAHFSVFNQLKESNPGYYEVYNIGTGIGTSVLELIHTFSQTLGVKLPFTIEPRRDGDMAGVVATSEKITKQLNWKSKYSISEAIISGYKFRTGKKLVQFYPYFLPKIGGLEKVGSDFSIELAKSPKVIQILFIGSFQQDVLFRMLGSTPIIVYPSVDILPNFPIPAFWRLQFWKQLILIIQFKPSFLVTHTRFFLINFFCFLLSRNKYWIHIEHGSGSPIHSNKIVAFIAQCIDFTFGRFIFSSANLVLCVSRKSVEFVTKYSTRLPPKLHYFGYPNLLSNPIRKINSIPKIGFIGRFVPLKGVKILLEALVYLKEKSFLCEIYGEGEDEKEYREIITKNNLDSQVKILGKKTNQELLQDIYPSFDIFINPSFQEGLPTTVVEALLSGVYVIATNVGGTSEISDKSDLVLIPPGDSFLLASKIDEAFHLYKTHSGLSQSSIHEKFSIEKNTEEFIRSCIEERG